jgi:hypothetical protein
VPIGARLRHGGERRHGAQEVVEFHRLGFSAVALDVALHADEDVHDQIKERRWADELDRHQLLLPKGKRSMLELHGLRTHCRAVRVWHELRQRGGYLPYIEEEEEKMG